MPERSAEWRQHDRYRVPTCTTIFFSSVKGTTEKLNDKRLKCGWKISNREIRIEIPSARRKQFNVAPMRLVHYL